MHREDEHNKSQEESIKDGKRPAVLAAKGTRDITLNVGQAR